MKIVIKDGFEIKCLEGMNITRIKKSDNGVEIFTNSTTDRYLENSYKIDLKDGKYDIKSPFYEIKQVTLQ